MKKTCLLAAFVALASCDVDDVDPVTVTVASTTPTSITLEWKTPYLVLDNGDVVPADRYELRYSTSPTATFPAMTPVPSAALPSTTAPRGSTVQATVTGLESDTTYWFIGRGLYDGHAQEIPRIKGTTAAHVPFDPILLTQWTGDGLAEIPPAGLATRPAIVLRARIGSPKAGAIVRLEVEIREVNDPFTGVPTAAGLPVSSGADATVVLDGLAAGTGYRWQARTFEDNGAVSAWVSAGSNPGDAADFATRDNAAPDAPGPTQSNPAGGVLQAGESLLSDDGVRFASTVGDPDSDEWIRLEIELRRPGEPFTGFATSSSVPTEAGRWAEIVTRPGDGSWKWRARTVDIFGAASAWESFGGNSDEDADFILIPGGSVGGSFCHQAAAARGRALAAGILVPLLAAFLLRR